MALVMLIAAALVLVGRKFGVSGRVLGGLVALLFAPILLIQLTLPDGHPLREATGGSFSSWMILLGVVGLLTAYMMVLRRLKHRAAPVPKSDAATGFSSSELDRYARHIVLREIGGPGQQRLKAANVLVIGAGGLGSPALMYLAAAGVGTIGVIDDDIVSLSNLQRQVLHSDDRIDMPKVFSAKIGLNALNPQIEIRPFNRRLTEEIAADLFAEFDLVLDGSDNFDTRYLVNRTCVALGIPLVSAAISQWEGQISLYHPAAEAPCFACIFPKAPAEGLAPTCAEGGVMGALPGVMGAMMASEAIKHITGAGATLQGAMVIYDALYGESRRMKLQRDDACVVCGNLQARNITK